MAVPDPLLPNEPVIVPVAEIPPSTRRPKIVCECCGCELTPTGDAINISDKFRDLRTQGEKITALKAELDRVQGELSTATRERDEARAQIPKKSSLW